MELRPYQRDALEAVRRAYREGRRRTLVVMPTGTGKTVLFAEIARLAKGPVLVLAHRQELVEQARDKIARWCGDVVAVEMGARRELTRGGWRTDSSGRIAPPAKVTVASVPSLMRRLSSLPRDAFRMVVVDEAHHATADSYTRILRHFDGHLLGVTATPDRRDGVGLGEVFDSVAYEYDMRAAIEAGWLAPIRSFLVQTRADFSRIRKVAGELSTTQVEEVLTKELHLAEVATPLLRERADRPAIVFAASVAHARALARVLCQMTGDRTFAVHVDGTMPLDRRAPILRRFERGEVKVLVNCSLFTEGFDSPTIALVAIARPVLSRPFYAQMVGRGTRLAPGKKDLLVLDYVPGNCNHSLASATDIFTGSEEPEVQELAREVARKASAEGQSISLERAVELARQEHEALRTDVTYRLRWRDPFQAIGIDLAPYRRRSKPADPITAEQLAYFQRAGLPTDSLVDVSARDAEALREQLLERKAALLCTPKQAARLLAHGIDPEHMYYDEAKERLAELEPPRRRRRRAPNG